MPWGSGGGGKGARPFWVYIKDHSLLGTLGPLLSQELQLHLLSSPGLVLLLPARGEVRALFPQATGHNFAHSHAWPTLARDYRTFQPRPLDAFG